MKLANGKKSKLLEYLMIIVGTGLMALAINSVFDASGMVTGGFSGVAIIVKAWTKGVIDGGIPLWVTNIGLNVPLFLIGWKIHGFSFVKKALIGEISLSAWLAFQPVWNLAGDDLLLAALYGGVIQGVGIGLVFLGGGTTGGTDMMAAIIQKYLKHYSIAQIMQIIDAGVVLVGMYVFGIHKALYAIIAVYLVTKVSDSLIEGLKFSKTAYIITGKPDEISNMIINDLDRGVTGINAKGMYSGQDKLMLFCVVNKKEIVMLKEKVDEFNSRRLTKENESRLLVNMEASIELEDDIYRSLGILQNCRIISAQEAMKHLSNIKLGIEMDYIKDISLEKVINLMTGMKPIMELMSPMTSDGDIKRADFLREEFTLANRNKK